MMEDVALVVAADDPHLDGPVMKEMVRQMRGVDTWGLYDAAAANEILDPFVLTKQRKREIPIVGDPDEFTLVRIKAYYNALSALIEQRTGLMAVPLVHLTYEGFGRAIISVGKLIVVDRTLRDVHRFGFRSLEAMHLEAGKLIDKATDLVETYREVAEL